MGPGRAAVLNLSVRRLLVMVGAVVSLALAAGFSIAVIASATDRPSGLPEPLAERARPAQLEKALTLAAETHDWRRLIVDYDHAGDAFVLSVTLRILAPPQDIELACGLLTAAFNRYAPGSGGTAYVFTRKGAPAEICFVLA